MHVLIIEKDAWITMMIEDALMELGDMSFRHAPTLEAAVDILGTPSLDLITAEIRSDAPVDMEVLDAFRRLHSAPLVFVTAIASEVRKRDPAAVVVRKPFAASELKAAVSQYMPPVR